MGSPLGPLLANVFIFSIKETLEHEGKLPSYYRRYVDDMLTVMPDVLTATEFLHTLKHAYSSVKFTMEIENKGMLLFLGIQLLNRAPRVKTKVCVEPTNTGLLIHFHSRVDNRYKRSLLTTMLDRARRLSSSWVKFSDECDRLKTVFSRLKCSSSRKVEETKPRIVNQQCVVCRFQCDPCDAGYVGNTRGHLHERSVKTLGSSFAS